MHNQKIIAITIILLLILVPLSNRPIFAYDGVIATVGLSSGANSVGIAINPNGEAAIADNALGIVSTIDTATNTVTGGPPIVVGSTPYGIVFDSSSNHYFEANNGDSTISVIDAGTHNVVDTITLPTNSNPTMLALDPIHHYIFSANSGLDTISVINTANDSIVTTISVNSSPYAVVLDSTNGYVYTANYPDIVSVINSATNPPSLIQNITIPAATSLDGIEFNPTNGNIYVSDGGASSVYVINGLTLQATSIPVGLGPQEPGYDPGNGNIYVPTIDDNSVSVINGATNSVNQTLSLVPSSLITNPFQALYNPINKHVYVTDTGSSQVSVLGSQSKTTITLSPSSVNVGVPTTVSVSVTGTSPTGTVTFTTTTGSGSFSVNSCTLVSGTCTVTFTPTTGPVKITATYGGDLNNTASSGQSTLTVTKPTTTTLVTLSPSSVNVGVPTTVSVSVTGSSPTGSVTFATNSTGSFNPTTCTLSTAKCSVTFTPSSAGSAVITANYGGDASNAASSGTSNLTVTQSTRSTLDAYNQFDPVTKNVLVYGIDNNGASFGPIIPTVTKTSWNGGDDYNLDNHNHDAAKLVNDNNHKHSGNDNHKHSGDNKNHKNTKVSFVPNLANSIVMTSWSSNINYDTNNLDGIILADDNHNNNDGNANNHNGDGDNSNNNGSNDKSGAIYNHADDNKNAELRTFHINNGGGNSLILIEKVLMGNNKITVHVISVQRNGGPVVQMPQNLKMFEWTDDKNNDGSNPGNMEKFQQTMIIMNGKLTQQITTSYDDDKKQTVIYTQNINEDFKHKNHLSDEIVKNGLVYLRMLTHQNTLTIGTS